MNRGSGALFLSIVVVVLVAMLSAAPALAAGYGADAAKGTSDGTSDAAGDAPGDAPYFDSLPAPPPATRLWAQLASSGDAFFTLERNVLPSPYTPPPTAGVEPRVAFEVYRYITTSEADGELQYGAREVRAAWDTRLDPEVRTVVEWRLSSGTRDVAPTAPAPPLLVTTTLAGVDENGFARLLGAKTVRATLVHGAEPTPVRVDLGRLDVPVYAGERLVLSLDWTWGHVPAVGPLRQPLVSVHPGSWLDLPILEPVRVESLQERRVLDELYVRADVAHIFAVENLDLQRVNLGMHGPGVNLQGGRPLVKAPHGEVGQGHVAELDWAIPIGTRHLTAGDYHLYLSAKQVEEDGPRAFAVRTLSVAAASAGEPEPGSAWLWGGIGFAGLAALVAVAVRRRVGFPRTSFLA